MRTTIVLAAAAFTFFSTIPGALADAAGCIGRCGAVCYGQQNPGACEQACTANCISQPDETSQVCGSIVVADGTNESMGWSWGAPDKASAERSAWEECVKGAPDCRPVITFCNECAAVARAWDDNNTLLGSFGSRRPATADAQQSAMETCQEEFPDASCKLAKTVCADSGPL